MIAVTKRVDLTKNRETHTNTIYARATIAVIL